MTWLGHLLLRPTPESLLDFLLALAWIGTAVALHPVVKRQNEGSPRASSGPRTLEAVVVVSGVISLLSVVTLRQAGAGAEAAASGQALVASYNGSFLFGPGFTAAANAVLLGLLLGRSRPVPRIIPLLGLIGAPLLLASDTAVLFGLWAQFPVPAGIATSRSSSGSSRWASTWSSEAPSPLRSSRWPIPATGYYPGRPDPLTPRRRRRSA
jgi:hypothetical protein